MKDGEVTESLVDFGGGGYGGRNEDENKEEDNINIAAYVRGELGQDEYMGAVIRRIFRIHISLEPVHMTLTASYEFVVNGTYQLG